MSVWHFDSAAVRRAFAEAAERFVSLCKQIPSDAWARPGLDSWSVRELVGHASRSLSTVDAYLDAGASPSPPVAGGRRGPGEREQLPATLHSPLDYYDLLRSAWADEAALMERGRQAAQALGADPVAAVSALSARVLEKVARTPDDAVAATPAGTIRLIDYLPTRVVELTVHGLDLSRAIGAPLGLSPFAGEVTLVVLAGLAASGKGPFADRGNLAIDAILALSGRIALPAGYSVI